MKRIYYLILTLFGGAVLFFILYMAWADTRLGISMISNVLVLIGGLWCGWLLWQDRALRTTSGIYHSHFRHIVWGALLGTGFVLVAHTVWDVAISTYITRSDWGDSAGVAEFFWIMVYYTLLSIPLQEIIFRGYFYSTIENMTRRPWLAIGGSTILYALAHLHYGWDFVGVTFGFGLIVGVVRWRTGSLKWPIYLHIMGGVGVVGLNVLMATR